MTPPPNHLCAGGRVGDEPDVEPDVLEKALDVFVVLDVERLHVGQHRHLGTAARDPRGIDHFPPTPTDDAQCDGRYSETPRGASRTHATFPVDF